jgi:hypothetical protein
MQRYKKDIIQTNNLSKNDKIQGKKSSKVDKIQRNNADGDRGLSLVTSLVSAALSLLPSYFLHLTSAIRLTHPLLQRTSHKKNRTQHRAACDSFYQLFTKTCNHSPSSEFIYLFLLPSAFFHLTSYILHQPSAIFSQKLTRLLP